MIDAPRIIEIVSGCGVVEDMAKFDPEKSFKDNGVDSLDVFTVLLAIEEKLDVKFTEEESENIRGIRDVLEIVNKNTA